MIAELLGKKLFNVVTPYKRIFLSFEVAENDNVRIYTLPALRMASYFFTKGDIIYIDHIDQLDKLTYLDYELINSKEPSLVKHREDWAVFKEIVKQSLAKNNSFALSVENKIIFPEVMHVVCKVLTEEKILLGDTDFSSEKATTEPALKIS